MALSKSAIQSRLSTALTHQNTDPSIKDSLEDLFERFPALGGISKQQQAGKVESFLLLPFAQWDLKRFSRAMDWLIENWKDIPA